MNFVIAFIIAWSFNLTDNIKPPSINLAMEKVETGSRIPDFTLPDQNGKMVDIKSFKGKKNLVIYFYPKDDSPGCTKEACSFRDQFEVFKTYNAEIIGISGDGIESHKKFAEKHRLSYILLSDKGNKIRTLFGVPTNLFGLLPGRVTYVVNKEGVVIHTFDSQLQTGKHIEEAIAALKQVKNK
jgi:peroxiredoxin Q/BCP